MKIMKKNIRNWWNKRKSENGAVVIEASISLTVFMFFIVTILSIVNICTAQTKIGLALNATAKEISQYSYLYSLTGLSGVQEENFEGTGEVRSSIDNILDGMTSMYNSLGTVKDVGANVVNGGADIGNSFETVKNELNSATASGETIYNELSAVASDPKNYIIGVARLGLNELVESGKSQVIAAPLTKIFIQKHLCSYEGQSCDEFLNNLNVVGGLNGINFDDSVFFLNGSDNIILVADYEIEVIKLLNHDITLHFTQSSATKAWSATPLGSDLPKREEPTPGGGEESTEESTEEDKKDPTKLTGEELQTYMSDKYGTDIIEEVMEGNSTDGWTYEEWEKQVNKHLGFDEEQIGRPSWQQSEIDIAKEYPEYAEQKSFIDGKEVKYGTPGSVRPDLYKDGYSIDVKNYNVISSQGRSNLVSNIKKQYEKREQELPEGTQQIVVIDIRGQNVSQEELQKLKESIMKATDNGVEIRFKSS